MIPISSKRQIQKGAGKGCRRSLKTKSSRRKNVVKNIKRGRTNKRLYAAAKDLGIPFWGIYTSG